jgi:hypothetical protein
MCVTGPIFVHFHTVQFDQSVDAFILSLSKPFSCVCVCVPNDDNKNVAQQFGRFKKSPEENRMDRPINHVGCWRLIFVEILHRNDAEFEDFSL